MILSYTTDRIWIILEPTTLYVNMCEKIYYACIYLWLSLNFLNLKSITGYINYINSMHDIIVINTI